MAPQEWVLTDRYLHLLARTGKISPDPTHDGERHVECEPDGAWSTIVTDRGHEYDRKRFTDLHELMFGLCAGATHEAAMSHVREHGLHAHELLDRAAGNVPGGGV